MGLLVLLKFTVKCFDIIAWPLFALGYPLCASIRAIELDSNSDIRKLVTYWVLFSLISLFDHAFTRLLEWLSFWPYAKLMAIFWLVVPHFDGSFYVYENIVRPCLSVNPYVVIGHCNKRKEFNVNRENFQVAAERYVKENGPGKCTKPNVDEKEIKAVEATETKEVDRLEGNKPNVAQETKAMEAIEKKEVAAAKWVNQTVPNLAQTENQVFTAAGTKETATTADSDSKLPNIPSSKKVQKEWTCALCQVTTQSETSLISHLKGKKHTALYEELKAESGAAKNKGSPTPTAKQSDQPKVETKKCVSGDASSNQKNTGKQKEKEGVHGKQQNTNKTGGAAIKRSNLWCYICNIKCPDKIAMDSHIRGRKHLARIRELNGLAGGGLV